MLPDRARRLVRKFAASPTLPILGWTKMVETLVAGGPTIRWAGYAFAVTLVWIYAEDIQTAADELADEAADTITDG
jgi:hypothetical protein